MNLAVRLILHSFLGALRREARRLAPGRERALLTRIRAEYPAIAAANRALVVDPQSEGHLLLCAAVLAGYRTLLDATGDETATVDALRGAFGQFMRRPMRWLFRLRLALSRDPLRAAARVWTDQRVSDRLYGRGFTFESHLSADGFRFDTKRCFYYEFFRLQGLPALTTVFCGWDQNWITAINDAHRGIAVGYSSRLSEGAPRCRLTVIRTERK